MKALQRGLVVLLNEAKEFFLIAIAEFVISQCKHDPAHLNAGGDVELRGGKPRFLFAIDGFSPHVVCVKKGKRPAKQIVLRRHEHHRTSRST